MLFGLARGDPGSEDAGPERDDELARLERFVRRALREVGSFVSDARRERAGCGGVTRGA